MKTFLCWGISKLEGLFGLLIWPAMFIIGDKEQLIFNQQGQLNADGWILSLIPQHYNLTLFISS